MNRSRPDQPNPRKPEVIRLDDGTNTESRHYHGDHPQQAQPGAPVPGAGPNPPGPLPARPNEELGHPLSAQDLPIQRRPEPALRRAPGSQPPPPGAPHPFDLRMAQEGGAEGGSHLPELPRIQHPRRASASQPAPADPYADPHAGLPPASTPPPTPPAANTPQPVQQEQAPEEELSPEEVEARFLAERSPNDLAALQETVARPASKPIIPEGMDDVLTSTTVSPRHKLEAWLAVMANSDASDLILRAGGRPSLRVNGRIQFLPGRVPGPGALLEVLEGVMGEKRMDTWRETGSSDAGLQLDGLGRFRLNAYRQMGEPAVVIRRINEEAPSINSLELPADDLKRLSMRKRGLVLVTGIAGSGKSTTLAAMIEHMNQTVERHVVTLEDPVELLFTENRCVISQREVGTDCMDFQDGLRHALRQSPDAILIGEMRDAETVIAALDATETGHLVLSTLHTVNAPQTLERILSFFPSEQHAQIRQRLADNIAGVLSQRLVPRCDVDGLIPAYELMVSTPHVRELLADGMTTELARVIDAGAEAGLESFNLVLKRLVLAQKVDLDDALAASDRPEELVLALRGITGSSAKVDASKARELRESGGADGLRMA